MKHMLVAGRRGRKEGGETPLIEAPLGAQTRERLLAELAGIPVKKTDLVEWRADHFEDPFISMSVGPLGAVARMVGGLRGSCPRPQQASPCTPPA